MGYRVLVAITVCKATVVAVVAVVAVVLIRTPWRIRD